MEAKAQVEELLFSRGFRLLGQHVDDDPKGTAVAEYEHQMLRIRLAWDGRDEALRLDIGDAPLRPSDRIEWSDLEQTPVAPDFEDDSLDAHIASLMATLERTLSHLR